MSFSQILGQERAKRILARVMAREKIPHAYLFTGIPGVGKTTTAMALSMALNCHEPIDGDACGHCVSCRQMKSGNFPDFLSKATRSKCQDRSDTKSEPHTKFCPILRQIPSVSYL